MCEEFQKPTVSKTNLNFPRWSDTFSVLLSSRCTGYSIVTWTCLWRRSLVRQLQVTSEGTILRFINHFFISPSGKRYVSKAINSYLSSSHRVTAWVRYPPLNKLFLPGVCFGDPLGSTGYHTWNLQCINQDSLVSIRLDSRKCLPTSTYQFWVPRAILSMDWPSLLTTPLSINMCVQCCHDIASRR